MKHFYYILPLFIVLTCCFGQGTKPLTDNDTAKAKKADTAKAQALDCRLPDSIGCKRIRAMLQDSKGNMWIGTEANGVFKYDGKSITRFTTKEGLLHDWVAEITEDKEGNIWFDCHNGICRYDGKSFTSFTDGQGPRNYNYGSRLEYKPDCVWIGNRNGVWCYDGVSLTNFIIHPASYKDSVNNMNRPYSVYCLLEDKQGNLWMGTEQMGVCRYDGKSFTYYTEKGLNKGAVRSILQDKAGNIWFGSNGGGVCVYDGKSFTNFSEQKGLSKNLAKAQLEDSLQKLNRVWSVTEDNAGNIWFGTIDEGAWRYDGKALTSISEKDGLPSDSLWTISHDKTGNTWLGSVGKGVFKYDGKSFTTLALKATIN